jgi:hypothetical protein
LKNEDPVAEASIAEESLAAHISSSSNGSSLARSAGCVLVGDGTEVSFRDNDGAFGAMFKARVRAMGIPGSADVRLVMGMKNTSIQLFFRIVAEPGFRFDSL